MKTIGIDPGLNGGMTCLDSTNGLVSFVESIPMPTVDVPYKKRTRKDIDTKGVCAFFERYKGAIVFMEKVGARPNQGAVSTFRFGEGSGIVSGIASGMGFRVFFPTPQAWMKVVFGKCPVSHVKKSIQWCKIEFPSVDWRKSKRAKKPHDGKTDSCAIAYFGCLIGQEVTAYEEKENT
jgi:crossover junction endodeoxyribonuclease RuvC